MATALAEVPAGLTRDLSLFRGYRFEREFRHLDELIKMPTGDRITTPVHDDGSFDKTHRRYTADFCDLDCSSKDRRIRLGPQDGDQR